ncbi:hypothetical protein TNCT_115921 [Trichonephila clavata]|uniref:Uncharacterized protein n=1 Tax=Trichonephila clavata TaxID=2740835 RepID=A0A8X6LTG5_TRICU|nr:hypothetical protein TNCT_115921 [Trichonephila clavata]
MRRGGSREVKHLWVLHLCAKHQPYRCSARHRLDAGLFIIKQLCSRAVMVQKLWKAGCHRGCREPIDTEEAYLHFARRSSQWV